MKGKISAELLQKIKDAVNLVDVVGEHVVLRKTGSNHSGLCPFHSERTPSFSVSESKQLYHCYGCKKGGDLVSFVMEIHGMSFPEAIRELADRAQVALPQEFAQSSAFEGLDQRQKEIQERTATAYKLNRFVAAYYHHLLTKLPEFQNYFKNRGVTQELIQAFYLGASLSEWEGLAQHLHAKKAPASMALELGLIRPSTKEKKSGTGYFDLFRNRLIFPIINTRGKVAGFGGRILPSGHLNVNKDEGPKYLNSSDSFIFQKSKLVFGLYQAQKHIREKDEVIIVEGYFDVLALHAAGFKNVVSTCGTALTHEHLQILKRFGSRIVILFDGDRAGIEATERAMEMGLDQGMVLYGAQMPQGKDPDEILFHLENGKPVENGILMMQEIFSLSQPLLDQRLDQEVQLSFKGAEARTQAVKKMSLWLNRFKDPVGKEVRLQEVCKKMNVSRSLFSPMVAGVPSGNQMKNQGHSSAPKTPVMGKVIKNHSKPHMTRAEKVLLQALIRKGEFSTLIEKARCNLPPKLGISDLFDYPPAKAFVVDYFEKNPPAKSEPNIELTPELDPLVRSIVTESLMEGDATFTAEDLQSLFDQRFSRIWARFSHEIKAALDAAEANKDAELQSSLMKEYLDVQRKMKELNYFYDNKV